MNSRNVLPCSFLAALLLALPLQSQTAPADTYRTGLKSIVIPAPSSDLPETGSDYRVVLENLVPESNRLVAAFVQPDDMGTIRAGGSPALARYALVEVLRRIQFADITPDTFRQVADSIAQQFGGDLSATMKEQQDTVNRRLKDVAANPTTVTIDKPVQLGAFFSKPDACAFGMITPYTTNGKTVRRAMGLIALRVQSRLLYLYLYSDYKDDSTVDWVRTASAQWADAVLKANQP